MNKYYQNQNQFQIQQFYKLLNKLPDELLREIFQYIPKKELLFLNKTNYLTDHSNMFAYINKHQYENYVRCMIRCDNDFVVSNLLFENFFKWFQMKKYYYKECVYANYMYFLESYAIDHQSFKCKKVLYDFFEKLGLNKNRHKKKIIRYIKWNN